MTESVGIIESSGRGVAAGSRKKHRAPLSTALATSSALLVAGLAGPVASAIPDRVTQATSILSVLSKQPEFTDHGGAYIHMYASIS